jgi:pantothenate kinase-related protein Tda10
VDPELRVNLPPAGRYSTLNGLYAFISITIITIMTESQDTSSTKYKAEIIAKHLKEKLGALRDETSRSARPLMVSMQGPQGAGKHSARDET